MTQLSKLQIRAKVMSAISEIKSLKVFNEDALEKFVHEFSQIEDKEAIFDIFIKEFIKMNETEYAFSSCVLKEIVPVEYINEKVFEYLKSNALSDDSKYKLVQLLRITGGNCNYNEIPSYFENPQEVLDLETKKLLENAVFNPEAMLDFLDFISAVSKKDRTILLESLKQDYQGDILANIVYPILYSDFEDKFLLDAIEILADSKSSIAIEPFNYLIDTSNNEEIVNSCKTGLKKLKLAGASKEKADEYFKNIIKNSVPAEFFTTIPDGNGMQALLASRRNTKNGKYLLAAIVTNNQSGIIDCFGFFNISQEELIKVLGKFYQTEGKYKVLPEYIKTKVNEAIDLTIKTKRKFPYEFICWNPIFSDIGTLDFDLESYAEKNCKQQLVKKDDILNLLTKEYTLRWFITPSEHAQIKSLTDLFYNTENIDISFINKNLRENENLIYTEETLNLWKNRIFNLIYLLRNNSLLKEADIFYTMLKNEEYFEMFKFVILQRSIFNHFVTLKENSKESLLTTNIFKKKSAESHKYDIKKINNLIDIMKRNWIDG